MTSIGFRCWDGSVAFVVLNGTIEAPVIVEFARLRAPRGASRGAALQWLRREVHEILTRHACGGGYFKCTEPVSRNKDLDRAQFEGVLQEAGLSHASCLEIHSRTLTQIRRDTGTTELARYLGQVHVARFPALDTANFRDAALAAHCGLPKNAHA